MSVCIYLWHFVFDIWVILYFLLHFPGNEKFSVMVILVFEVRTCSSLKKLFLEYVFVSKAKLIGRNDFIIKLNLNDYLLNPEHEGRI